jgi:hypothetical protein
MSDSRITVGVVMVVWIDAVEIRDKWQGHVKTATSCGLHEVEGVS